jgi:hypothetical protein
MVFQTTIFSRVFSSGVSGGLIPRTTFGFESQGQPFYVVTIYGSPRIEQGMTVIALLKSPNGFGGDGLFGWIDCKDGSIACDSAARHAMVSLLGWTLAYVVPIRAYQVLATPSADWFAYGAALAFGAVALRGLWESARAFMIQRALVAVRDQLVSGLSGQ